MLLPELHPVALVLIGLVSGAIAGSFIATIVVRWPQGRSVIAGRSACDACGKPLRATELVPILSYLASRGRCRPCGGAIDRRHFDIELASAGLGAVALVAQPGPVGLVSAVFGWWLLAIAALDLEHHWLPDKLTLPLIPAGLAIALIPIGLPLEDRAIGAIAGFLTLAILRWAYRRLRGHEGMGGGDPKLIAGLGAWIGWQQLPILLLGAGVIGLLAVLLKHLRGERVAASDRLPLGTLMAMAAWPIWLLTSAS